jgi:hypothetical protein
MTRDRENKIYRLLGGTQIKNIYAEGRKDKDKRRQGNSGAFSYAKFAYNI